MIQKLWEKRHLVLAIIWVLLAIPTLIWWNQSILWVLILSLYANFEASLAAYNAQKDKKKCERCDT